MGSTSTMMRFCKVGCAQALRVTNATMNDNPRGKAMEWEELKGYFTGECHVVGRIDVAMECLCDKLGSDVLPMSENVDWDYVRIEVWADSGRFIAYPAKASSKSRIDKAGCQVVFDELASRIAELDKLLEEGMSDEQYEQR